MDKGRRMKQMDEGRWTKEGRLFIIVVKSRLRRALR